MNNTLCKAFLAGAAFGVALSYVGSLASKRHSRGSENEAPAGPPTVADAQAVVGRCLSGTLQAAQLFVGDRLGLYTLLRDTRGSTTAIDLAAATGLSQRWLREWLAQQAAMGVLELEEGVGESDSSLHYRMQPAFATVLADPASPDYDIGLIQAAPSWMIRAKQLPEIFKHGRGVPYDDHDISAAIDRSHAVHTKHVFIPNVIPMVAEGRLLAALEAGVRCADLGCGSGCLLLELAARFPRSDFHGFEISDVALEQANAARTRSNLRNLTFHDSRQAGSTLAALGPFAVILTFDVLHDATQPQELIATARDALSPGGVWVLGDINCAEGVRGNLMAAQRQRSATYFSVSLCLCLPSALSEPGGAGIGTLGFSVSLARKMLGDAGLKHVAVLLEHKTMRWYEVAPSAQGILEEYAIAAKRLRDFI
jgi:2-polyprenyl-3-methyl-5-hydroxy-6-metoxy-1,4-benzoquinol methylase